MSWLIVVVAPHKMQNRMHSQRVAESQNWQTLWKVPMLRFFQKDLMHEYFENFSFNFYNKIVHMKNYVLLMAAKLTPSRVSRARI